MKFIIILLLFHEQKDDSNNVKRAKADSQDDEDCVANLVCLHRYNYEHLIDISWLNDSELIATGVNPITMIAQLPASLKEKRFGVS